MIIASISEIKRELKERSHEEVLACCLRMARFKRENKELLNYLLFEAIDEENFISGLKEEIEYEFSSINLDSLYYAKKSIRRILRLVTKHIRYSGIKQTEVEILIFFCQQFRKLPLKFSESKVLINLYQRQLKNIEKSMAHLDEDLKFDYQSEWEEVNLQLPQM